MFLWDLHTAKVAARLRDPKQHQPTVACAWSPLGLPLVSCDKAGGLSFWVGKSGASGGGGGGGSVPASPRHHLLHSLTTPR